MKKVYSYGLLLWLANVPRFFCLTLRVTAENEEETSSPKTSPLGAANSSMLDDGDDKCVICLETRLNFESILTFVQSLNNSVTLPCGHRFHESCSRYKNYT